MCSLLCHYLHHQLYVVSSFVYLAFPCVFASFVHSFSACVSVDHVQVLHMFLLTILSLKFLKVKHMNSKMYSRLLARFTQTKVRESLQF